MITEGNKITEIEETEKSQKTKTHQRKIFVMGILAVLMLAMFVTPGAAAINVTQITQAMTDIGGIIDSLSVIWTALVNMIIGLMPLMIVLAVIGFVLGIFAVILDKIKGDGGFKGLK